MQTLTGKRVLITGAAKRLGRAMALAMGEAGAHVAITYRGSEQDAIQTADRLARFSDKSFAIRADVTNSHAVTAALDAVKHDLGGLDILINNAANFETAKLDELTPEQWDAMFTSNTRAPFFVAQAALPMLRKSRGRVINIGSLGGLRPWATHAHYCASKSALHMLTQIMAKGFAPDISVNCVAPGKIDQNELNDLARAHFAEKTPMKRNGLPEDVVEAVMFFATCSSFITGQILFVDGGLELIS